MEYIWRQHYEMNRLSCKHCPSEKMNQNKSKKSVEEKRNHCPLVNCHFTANFYPRKSILSTPAKGFKSRVFPEPGQNQTSQKPCNGTSDRESKNRVAKLTNTHAEGARRQVGNFDPHSSWRMDAYGLYSSWRWSQEQIGKCYPFTIPQEWGMWMADGAVTARDRREMRTTPAMRVRSPTFSINSWESTWLLRKGHVME